METQRCPSPTSPTSSPKALGDRCLTYPSRKRNSLQISSRRTQGAGAAVLGYPENGPYTVEPARLGEAAALAAAAAATGGREVAAGAIQAHGGIGFTWEADVHWLYKRAEVDRALLGGSKRHHAALARAAADRIAVGWAGSS